MTSHLTVNELCPHCHRHTVTVTDCGGRYCATLDCDFSEPEPSPAIFKPTCPRCRNRGFYTDNDAEGHRRGMNWVRCDCQAGDPDLD